jgi:hypothetical protein
MRCYMSPISNRYNYDMTQSYTFMKVCLKLTPHVHQECKFKCNWNWQSQLCLRFLDMAKMINMNGWMVWISKSVLEEKCKLSRVICTHTTKYYRHLSFIQFILGFWRIRQCRFQNCSRWLSNMNHTDFRGQVTIIHQLPSLYQNS